MVNALIETLIEILGEDYLTNEDLKAWSISMSYVIGQMSDLMKIKAPRD